MLLFFLEHDMFALYFNNFKWHDMIFSGPQMDNMDLHLVWQENPCHLALLRLPHRKNMQWPYYFMARLTNSTLEQT